MTLVWPRFTALDRRSDLACAAAVCTGWRLLAAELRCARPACAGDVALRLRRDAAMHDRPDGEYLLYHRGNYLRPMRIYCHNVLSERPTEFVSWQSGVFEKLGSVCVTFSEEP